MESSNEVNSFFYRFFQMAYDYINHTSPDSVQGSPKFYKLLRKRIECVLDDKGLESEDASDEDWRTEDIQAWFTSKHRENAPRLIEGKIGDFKFNLDLIDESFNQELNRRLNNSGYQLTDDDRWNDLGLDCYATYLPLHFFYNGDEFTRNWGIYISEEGIIKIATFLYQATKKWPRNDKVKNVEAHFIAIAFEMLLRHEMEHFKIESFALNAEMIWQKPVYRPYIMSVYAQTYPGVECLEEGAANSTVVNSTRINNLFNSLFPWISKQQWGDMLERDFFTCQPICYQNTNLAKGWPTDADPFKNTYVSYESGRKSKLGIRTRGMNYLCNQILACANDNLVPHADCFPRDIPFFAFMPDNHFLRAENLVPIHLVQSLNPDDCMIGMTLPKAREFIDFIRELGFKQARSNDHFNWQSPHFKNPLNLSFHRHHEVDNLPFATSLENIGITYKDYMAYRQMNKEKKKQFIQKVIANGPYIPLRKTV